MPINNRGLAGQPIMPYTDFRSYAGADAFVDMTFLDHTNTEVQPTSIQYQLDDITNDINMIPPTAISLTTQSAFNIVAGNGGASPYSASGSGNGYYLGTFNGGVIAGSVLPVNQQLNGVNVVACACRTVGGVNTFTLCLQGTLAQTFFTSLSFIDRLGNTETYLAASASFSTSTEAGYSIWTWSSPTLVNPFTPTATYTITIAGMAAVVPMNPSLTLQIPGSKLAMTYQYQGSQLCQLTVTAVVIDSVTGQPATIRNVAILELCAIQTPNGT